MITITTITIITVPPEKCTIFQTSTPLCVFTSNAIVSLSNVILSHFIQA